MVEAGYPVTILTGRGGDAAALACANVVVIPELDSEHPENQSIARALDEGRWTRPHAFEAFQARIENLLAPRLVGADILIVHNVLNFHFNLPLTAALHRMLDRGDVPPLIAWCHDVSRYVALSSGVTARWGFPWDLLRTYRPEIRYVAVSSSRRRLLAETLGVAAEQVRVIPNGVAPERLLALSELGQHVAQELKLDDADLILLMPIRITRAKNIEYALRVTAALKREGLEPRLIVTGPPDPHAPDRQSYFEQLLALRRDLELESEAAFLYAGVPGVPGPLAIEPAMVAELYRLTDVVFMPSHREGFGLPVLEAAMFGKVVFATEVPAVDEVGAETVYTIAPDESAAHVAARMIEWAEQNVEQRLRRRVRQEYTWQAIFERAIEPLLLECVRAAKERVR